MGEFLAAHQNIAAPLIEWGGLLFLLAIILSPFLIVRHHIFRPTRWWHVVGAYFFSYALYLIEIRFIDFTAGTAWNWFSIFLHRYNFVQAFEGGQYWLHMSLLFSYSLLVFYAAKMLYGSLSRKRFWFSMVIASVLFLTLFFGLPLVTVLIIIYSGFINL